MSLTSNDVGKSFHLETYLKLRYKNLVLLSLLDASTLKALGQDPQAWHVQNAPSFPPGGPTRYNDYLYAKFATVQGETVFIGLPWINPNTVEEVGATTTVITVQGANSNQLTSLREYMLVLGLNNFSIDTQ